jgi:hypothetical protein
MCQFPVLPATTEIALVCTLLLARVVALPATTAIKKLTHPQPTAIFLMPMTTSFA